MKVKFFCPYWGSEHLEYSSFLEKVKSAGYDGAELIIPYGETTKKEIVSAAKALGLEIIAQWGGTIAGAFDEHLETYEKHLRNGCSVSPKFMNVQSGRDHYSYKQNRRFIDIAALISAEMGTKIVHETQRGMFSFSAKETSYFLYNDEELRITADFSHWCNVSESLLQDQEDYVKIGISRSDHIHARVGFEEGPQIPDPRAPEWSDTLEIHMHWWDQIIQRAAREGMEEFTITPEFGPFPYMTKMPFTGQPITSQWDVNLYMKEILDKRFNNQKNEERVSTIHAALCFSCSIFSVLPAITDFIRPPKFQY